MAVITLDGTPKTHTIGELPELGKAVPDFLLESSDMEPVSLEDFTGKNVILYFFSSIEKSMFRDNIIILNRMAAEMSDTVVLCISMDPASAHEEFCAANKTVNVTFLSAKDQPDVGIKYGVQMEDVELLRGPLWASAVIVANKKGIVIHNELVRELRDNPDVEACFKSVRESSLGSRFGSAALAASAASAVSGCGGTDSRAAPVVLSSVAAAASTGAAVTASRLTAQAASASPPIEPPCSHCEFSFR